MSKLAGKNVVILGATGSVGAAIVGRVVAEEARTLAVARGRAALDRLAGEVSPLQVLAVDATSENAAATVFEAMEPDVLVVCGGARPPTAPLHELTWSQFSVNWESDVKMSFHFCKAALERPLRRGSTVILISSGAGLGGSPISGGYAGAKRTQMFLANYGQKESNRLELGIRFMALAPATIMPDTKLGRYAVEGYARYLGMSADDFVNSMKAPTSPVDVANAVVDLLSSPTVHTGGIFTVSPAGLATVP
ncbi:MAG TPA: SDR family oxidoreductase [Steroidobacteraceae bacterium]|nr:SDR family oxidoreductase [Steroidobacteraceae bacterium]